MRRRIRGHTHHPAVHALQVDGERGELIVLGDWFEQGRVPRVADGRDGRRTLPLEEPASGQGARS